MKKVSGYLFVLVFLVALPAFSRDGTATEAIDMQKARALHQRERNGETLSAEEIDYLERAKAQRREQGRTRGNREGNSGQRQAPERLIPLTDFATDVSYQGEDGGLYGNGVNSPPEILRKAAEEELGQIAPLDAEGKPSKDGKIVFVSISMSNATQEFSRFKQLADASGEKAAHTVVVDCAQGGQAMAEWVPEDGRPWQVAMQRLQASGVAPNQVQVAWVKLANKSPSGSLEEHGERLATDTIQVLQNAKKKFPNLRIAYLGSRIWAGNATGQLNPEPYAYETAFVARWLIQRQMEGDSELTRDKTPLLLWGPYLWAEGERGRQTDGLVWLKEDFAGDGVHPSDSGRQKVAELLLEFVTENRLAKSWFTGE